MIEESKVFGTQKKQKYGMFNTFRYHLHTEWETDKRLPILQCALIVPAVLQVFLQTLLPSEAVRGLEGGWTLERLVLWLVLLAALSWICNAAVTGLSQYMILMGDFVRLRYEEKIVRKMMYLDYDVMEREQALSGNVWKAVRSGEDFERSATLLPQIILSFFGMIFCGILIIQKDVLLLIPSLIAVVVKIRLTALVRRKHREKHALLSRYVKETAYISRQSKESSAGKDIRIYRMADLFLTKYSEALKAMDRIFHTIHLWYHLTGVTGILINCAVDCFLYLYPVYMVLKGDLSISSFVLYVGLIRDFADYFSTVNSSLMTLNPFFASVNCMREFLELPGRWPKRDKLGDTELERLKKSGVTLELRDVSYTYPGRDEPALSHISLTIRPGEKLALLGLNGAGKTTLVKLVCGFYTPDEGEILLNGIPADNYDRDEYYSLISVLFQDSTLLPFTLDENLTGQQKDAVRRERLESALELSGFAQKYHSLTEKGDSLLIKEVNEQAVDFSGGEKQKLTFARALYKEAPFLILDEPTAALDPIAESELYRNFNEAAKGRTAIYISHRLSSTRFCDRIVLLEHGKIIEEGTHEELMAGATRYAALYEVQSRYYREDKERREREEKMGDIHRESEEQRRLAFDESR